MLRRDSAAVAIAAGGRWPSALAHGDEPDGLPVVVAALASLVGLADDDRATLLDALLATLGDQRRRAVEDLMRTSNYEYKSDFAKGYCAEGRAEGIAAGKAEGVLTVLDARGLSLDEATRQRVHACVDPAVLDRWLRRAAVAVTAAEVFAEDDAG